MKVHPDTEIFPLMEGEEFERFVEDIAANGLQVPIAVTPDGVLLDGRNRLRACERLGIEPVFQTIEADPSEYIQSLNLYRRHLTTEQKKEVARKFMEMHPDWSNRKIAKQSRLNPSTVDGMRRSDRYGAGNRQGKNSQSPEAPSERDDFYPKPSPADPMRNRNWGKLEYLVSRIKDDMANKYFSEGDRSKYDECQRKMEVYRGWFTSMEREFRALAPFFAAIRATEKEMKRKTA